MTNSAPKFEAQYFREYGTHSVENGASSDHLASYPDWDSLTSGLRSNLPSEGRIITPEYATVNAHEFAHGFEANSELINQRIEEMKDISRSTDATIILGTPTIKRTRETPVIPSRLIRHNSAVELHRGEVVGVTHKSFLLDQEINAGLEPDSERQKLVKRGQAVLICADLMDYPSRADSLYTQTVTDLVAPMMWATKGEAFSNDGNDSDEYHRKNLEIVMGQDVLKLLPRLNRVTTIDKGRPDIAPYNAVFKRTD